MAFIYILENKTNGKMYVGQTIRKNLTDRLKYHKYYKTYIGNAIRKYGFNNFNIYSFECEEEDLDYFECGFIKQLNTLSPIGYNLTYGGDGGDTFTNNPNKESIRKKLSEKNRGKIGIKKTIAERIEMSKRMKEYYKTHKPRKGYIFSEETKKKISDKLKENYKNGYIHPRLGKKASIETRIKLRESHIGIQGGEKHPMARMVVCIENGKIFNTIKDAAKWCGKLKGSNISQCLSGKNERAYGFKWKYYGD